MKYTVPTPNRGSRCIQRGRSIRTAFAATLVFAACTLFASEPPLVAKPLVVATEQAPWLTHDAGRFRILVSSESTNGQYSVLELNELSGYKTPPHLHPDMDETFYVLEGTLELRIAGKTHRLATGSYVHVPRNTPHAQGSADHNPVRLLVTLSPGGFESFFLDRADLMAKMPREHPEFRRHYLEIVRKYSRWYSLPNSTVKPMGNAIALFGSSRRHGNTGQLIDHIASELDIEVVDLGQMRISAYDYQHRNRGDDFEPLMTRVLDFDQIIVASPVYWYSISPPVKIFLDRISDYLDIPELLEEGRRLRGKTGHIVCTSIYDNAPTCFVEALTATFAYLGMHFGGIVHANCSEGYSRSACESDVATFARLITRFRSA